MARLIKHPVNLLCRSALPAVCIIFLVSSPLFPKDHAYGPWNIDVTGSLHLESKSNIYYEHTDKDFDIIFHIIPKIKFEYEKYEKVLFSTELELDSNLYIDNSGANITEMFFRTEGKPGTLRKYGAYGLFAGQYERYQSYSPDRGLLAGNLTSLEAGGGYQGGHLDSYGTVSFTRGFFSPDEFSVLDYSKTAFSGNFEYRIHTLCWIGGFEFGQLNYKSNLFNDGNFWSLKGGIKKDFSIKTSLEFSTKYFTQNHSSGDRFAGILLSLEGTHITFSGKTALTCALEQKIEPSMSVGSDFAQISRIRVNTKTEFTYVFTGEYGITVEFDSLHSRDDREFQIFFSGGYKLQRFLTLDFGIRFKNRSSSIEEIAFNSSELFIGISGTY